MGLAGMWLSTPTLMIPHEEDKASPWNVVLGVLAIVGQTPKQVAFVAHKGEAVPKPRTWRGPIFGRLCFESLPFPPACLQNQDSGIESGMSWSPSGPGPFVMEGGAGQGAGRHLNEVGRSWAASPPP